MLAAPRCAHAQQPSSHCRCSAAHSSSTTNDGSSPSDLSAHTGKLEPATQAVYECPVPGLLLRTDRFNGSSDAFLGRGASAAVSKGTWIQVVAGQKEVRTAVAVKEVPRTGLASEKQVMRELLLLKQKLHGTNYPNIIRVYDVATTSNTFYVIMQWCNFSLAQQPVPFQKFLHTGGEGKNTNKDTHAGALILDALVQDLLRAVSLLHSKHIMHCDIKVRFLRAACPLLRFVSWLNDPHRVCACAVIFSHAAWQLADIVQPFRKAPRVLSESIPLSTVSSSRCVSPHLTVKRSNRDNDVLFFRNLL